MRKNALMRQPVLLTAVSLMTLAVAVAMGASISPRVSGEAQLRLSHAALIVVAVGLGGLAVYYRDWTRGVLHDFFLTATRPLNLALYRIVLFATIFLDLDRDANPAVVTFFAGLPKDLQFPPPGTGPLLEVLPISEPLARLALHGITAFSFLAMIGLFTRTAAWLAVACMLYGLGIAQFYGQTNHYHHMIWFAAILGASRCGDVLSVDALLSARRRAGRGEPLEPPAEAVAYTLPLRFVWVLLGLIYFFPGFWKYWRSGFDWAFSDNFQNQLHLKWMQRDWLPALRIDRVPLLCYAAALGAMVWELSFLPAVFFRNTRLAVALVGALFHVGTRVLMHISFWTLQTSYLSLFNWDGIFRRLGKRLYREEMLVLFDGADAAVRRRIAGWRTLDVFFGRVTYVDVRNVAAVATAGLEPVDPRSIDAGVRVVVGDEVYDGRPAWRLLAHRIPPLWPVLPVIDLLAPKRRAPEDVSVMPSAAPLSWAPRYSIGPVTAVFLVLLVGNLAFGLKENRNGYPFTCYPPFSRNPGTTEHVIHMQAVAADGLPIPWDEKALKRRFGSARYVSMIKKIRDVRDPEEKRRKMHAFWEVARAQDPRLQEAQKVYFWQSTLSTNPADRGQPPVRKELVYTYNPAAPTDAITGHTPGSETFTSVDEEPMTGEYGGNEGQ